MGRRGPCSRWGLRVKWINGDWVETACRFDPDTYEQARHYGQLGIDRWKVIEAFEVVDRRALRARKATAK